MTNRIVKLLDAYQDFRGYFVNSIAPIGAIIDVNVPDLGVYLDYYVSLRYFRHNKKYIHVSDLVTKCPRILAFEQKFDGTRIPNTIPNTTLLTFKVGEALADVNIEHLCELMPDKVWGVWSCNCGKTSITGTYQDAKLKSSICPKCETGVIQYTEYHVVNEDYGISGSVDLVIKTQDVYCPVELKSISKKQFEALKKAKPEHEMQALMYWRLMRDKGYRVPDSAIVLYTCKEYTKPVYKQYNIKVSKEVQNRIQEYCLLAKHINSYQSLPDVPAGCIDVSKYAVRSCMYSSICINNRHN